MYMCACVCVCVYTYILSLCLSLTRTRAPLNRARACGVNTVGPSLVRVRIFGLPPPPSRISMCYPPPPVIPQWWPALPKPVGDSVSDDRSFELPGEIWMVATEAIPQGGEIRIDYENGSSSKVSSISGIRV